MLWFNSYQYIFWYYETGNRFYICPLHCECGMGAYYSAGRVWWAKWVKKREKSARAALYQYRIKHQTEYWISVPYHGGTLHSNILAFHPSNMEYQPSGPPTCPATSKSGISPALLQLFPHQVAQMLGICSVHHIVAALRDSSSGSTGTASVLAAPKKQN